jgi:uncharacterized membrane protein
MKLLDAIQNVLTEYALVLSLLIGTLFGLMANLAKALNKGTVPGRSWWMTRLLLTGFFALAAGWASEIANLSNLGAAFLASLLNLMGFVAVELIEERGARALAGDQTRGDQPIGAQLTGNTKGETQ